MMEVNFLRNAKDAVKLTTPTGEVLDFQYPSHPSLNHPQPLVSSFAVESNTLLHLTQNDNIVKNQHGRHVFLLANLTTSHRS